MFRVVRVRVVLEKDGTLRETLALEVEFPKRMGYQAPVVLEVPGADRKKLRASRWLPVSEV